MSVRRKAVMAAWKRVSNGAEQRDRDDVMEYYLAERHPDVLRGVVKAADMFDAVSDALPPVVTQRAFDEYHTAVGDAVVDDRDFHNLVTKVWGVDQPPLVAKQPAFRAAVVDGFQSSAYRGAPKRLPPPDASEARVPVLRSLPLDPYPMPKQGLPVVGKGHNVPPLPNGNDKFKAPEWMDNGNRFTGDPSQRGRIQAHTQSRGFLETESAAKAIGGGGHGDDLMDQYLRNKALEEELDAQRRALLMRPFQTAEPPVLASTTQLEHASYLPALNRDPVIRTDDPATKPTLGMGDDEADEGAIKAELEGTRDRGRWKKTGGLNWMTTQRDHFAKLDTTAVCGMNTRYNPVPVPHVHEAVDDDTRAALGISDGRPPKRVGECPTEYTDHMTDRLAEAERETKFNAKGTFGVSNGVRKINPIAHQPKDVKTGLPLRPTDVVPGQFSSTTRTLHA